MKRYLVILFSFMLLMPVQTAFAQVSNVPKPSIERPKPQPKPRPQPRPRTQTRTKPAPRPPRPQHNGPSVDVTFSCNIEDVPVFISIDGKQPSDIDEIYNLTIGNHKVRVTADGYVPYSTPIKVVEEGDFFYFELSEATGSGYEDSDVGDDDEDEAEPDEPSAPMDINAPFVPTELPPESTQPEVSVLVEDPANAQKFLNDTITVNGVSFVMVFVPGGTYTRYEIPENLDSIIDMNVTGVPPAHRVSLSNFHIGMCEVTWDLWYAVMEDSIVDYYHNRPYDEATWFDCQQFIDKLNKLTGKTFRLPTDAEWEYAARGGNKSNGYVYSGSNNIDEVAWYYENYEGEWHEVATKAPNELGIYDMTGGACEWCADWYNWPDANEDTPPLVNPKGPLEEQKNSRSGNPMGRTIRGGSYGQDAAMCCVFKIYYANPQKARYGLRLAM